MLPTAVPTTPELKPDREASRLQLLRDYGILDTPPDAAFDAIVSEAARLFDTPTAGVSIVDEQRVWLKSRRGLPMAEMSRAASPCACAVQLGAPLIAPDARAHPRLAQLTLVANGAVGFYAGVPLTMPEGHSLGTLFVADATPRTPAAIQIECLQGLAGQVVELLVDRRRALRPPPPGATPPKRTVLIVDDEESVRTLVRVLVERRGAQAITANDGLDALKKYRAHAAEIGVVLTDIHMPNLNGLDLIRALRAKESPPPIVVMCGRLDEKLIAEINAEHVSCVLAKPFQISEFEAVLSLLPAPAAGA